jgi:hypothetical protein
MPTPDWGPLWGSPAGRRVGGRSGLAFGFSELNNSQNRRHRVDNLVVQSSSALAVTNLVDTTHFRHQTGPPPPKTGLYPLGTSVAPANHVCSGT